MSVATSLKRDEFLDQVAAGLADLSQEDRDEVLEDLRTHLAEMDDDEIAQTLGTPESFVSEFRTSAGLEKTGKLRRRRFGLAGLRRPAAELRRRLEDFGRHLAASTRWHTFRPIWVWVRGWLLISAVAVLSQPEPFERFPIPSINGQWIGPLFMVVAATWFSLWLERTEVKRSELVSGVFSAATVVVVVTTMFAGITLSRPGYGSVEPVHFTGQLTNPEGGPIYNIYAYDLEGNPVDVYLFDQNGQPIRSMPDWMHEEAELFNEPFYFEYGTVMLPRDINGRLVPNLYPLAAFDHEGSPLAPPWVAFPELGASLSGPSSVIEPEVDPAN